MRIKPILSNLVVCIAVGLASSAFAESPTETNATVAPTMPPPPSNLSPGAVTLIPPTQSDKAALAGLKEVKMVFDIGTGDPNKLLSRLELIEQTRAGLVRQGVKPRFVLAFRGPASRLTQKDLNLIKASDQAMAAKIHEQLVIMSKDKNLELDQCAMGNTLQRVKNEDTYPELNLVSNSIVTISAYQNKGYGYLAFE